MKLQIPFALALAASLLAAPARAQDAPAAPPARDAGALITSSKGPGGRSITAFDRHLSSGIGGYYDLEFSLPFQAARPSAFDLHHLILTASSYLHDNLFFNAEVEFEHGGLLGVGTNDGALSVEQAWADYRISDLLTLRGGVVLIPFGIVNVLHDSDVRESVVRPLYSTTIVPSTWSDAGVGAYGSFYPTEEGQLSYELYATNGLTDAFSVSFGSANARPSLKGDNNGNKAISGRVAYSPFLGLEAAFDFYRGAYESGGAKAATMLGGDLDYAVGPFELLAEGATVLTEGGTSTSITAPTAIPTNMGGYYVEGRYRFFPELLESTFLGRAGGFDSATFTAYGRFGQVDTNQAAFDASDRLEAVLGLNYRPIRTFAFKNEIQRLAEPATGKTEDTFWSSVAVGF